MLENEVIIFSPQKVSCVIGLYTTFMHGIITHEMQIFYLQKHFLKKVWRRNVDPNPNNQSPSDVLCTSALFQSYFQKYESSIETLGVNGLMKGMNSHLHFL